MNAGYDYNTHIDVAYCLFCHKPDCPVQWSEGIANNFSQLPHLCYNEYRGNCIWAYLVHLQISLIKSIYVCIYFTY